MNAHLVLANMTKEIKHCKELNEQKNALNDVMLVGQIVLSSGGHM